MNTAIRTSLTLVTIVVNLIIGNAILFFGGKRSFGENINYPLMAGMSIACIIYYFLFYKFSYFEIYSNLKLIFLSVLSCIAIIFIGNFFAILIKEPLTDLLSNISATIFMGIMGNIFMFPISLILGLINFGIITYFNKKMKMRK